MPTEADYKAEESRYQTYRDYVKHEDGLINYRLTWNSAIQAFLIATWGLLIKESEANELARAGAWVIPFAGFAISMISLIGIRAASRAIVALESRWSHLSIGGRVANGLKIPGLPPLAGGGADGARWVGFFISAALPGTIATLWLAILCVMLAGLSTEQSPADARCRDKRNCEVPCATTCGRNGASSVDGGLSD